MAVCVKLHSHRIVLHCLFFLLGFALVLATDDVEQTREAEIEVPVEDGTSDTVVAEEVEVSASDETSDQKIKAAEEGSGADKGEEKQEDGALTLRDILHRVMNPYSFDGVSEEETSGEAANTSESSQDYSLVPPAGNETVNANSTLHNNTTAKVKKFSCIGRNLTNETVATVRLVNSTTLLHRLTFKNESEGNCVLVMFYAPWCMFCARTAPHYNAVARAFPQLEVVAVDAVQLNSLNARFGTVAVPNVVIFHNSKAVAKFPLQERNFTNFVNFVTNITGLHPLDNITVLEEDYLGPLPSVPTQDTDLVLCVSWVFVITFCGILFARSRTGRKIWTFLQHIGAEHQHID